jgi:hypothetical protein
MSNIDDSWCKLYMYNLRGIEAVVIVVLTVVLIGALTSVLNVVCTQYPQCAWFDHTSDIRQKQLHFHTQHNLLKGWMPFCSKDAWRLCFKIFNVS